MSIELFEEIKARRLLPPQEVTDKDCISTDAVTQPHHAPIVQSTHSANIPISISVTADGAGADLVKEVG